LLRYRHRENHPSPHRKPAIPGFDWQLTRESTALDFVVVFTDIIELGRPGIDDSQLLALGADSRFRRPGCLPLHPLRIKQALLSDAGRSYSG
jgi:hypothetical protein